MSALTSIQAPIARPTVSTTMLLTLVQLVCPHCAEQTTGALVDCDDGVAYVQCNSCDRELDVAVLAVPTQTKVDGWRADALLHGVTALQCADGVHGCSYLATASCRRLARELTPLGKLRLLGEIGREAGESCTPAQRTVLLELGVALGLDSGTLNGFLALR